MNQSNESIESKNQSIESINRIINQSNESINLAMATAQLPDLAGPTRPLIRPAATKRNAATCHQKNCRYVGS